MVLGLGVRVSTIGTVLGLKLPPPLIKRLIWMGWGDFDVPQQPVSLSSHIRRWILEELTKEHFLYPNSLSPLPPQMIFCLKTP